MPWNPALLASLLDDAALHGAAAVLAALGVAQVVRLHARVNLLFDDCSPEEGVEYASGLWDTGRSREALDVLERVLAACMALGSPAIAAEAN
jgi:hypothetical protein